MGNISERGLLLLPATPMVSFLMYMRRLGFKKKGAGQVIEATS